MIGIDLTKGNVTKSLLRFTVPFLVANVLSTLYGLVDMYIVGQYADATQISGVSIGSGVMMLVNCLLMGLGTGGTVLVGQMAGSRREKDEKEVISTVFTVFPLTAVMLIVVGFALKIPMLHLLNAPPESFDAANAYVSVCLFGLFFTGVYCAIAAVLRGKGDSKGPTVFVAISCLCNIVGDIFCVGTLGMGAGGAALATTVSQGVSVAAGFIYLHRHNFPFDFRPSSFRIYKSKFKMLLRIGIPTALQETLTSISLLVLEAIINSMGYVASAAVGVCNRVFNVAIVPGLAFAAAISAMVAQNTGAGEYLRGKKCLRVGLGLTVAVAALIFLLMAFFPAQIIGIFTHDKAVIASGVEYMTFYKFDCMICSIAFCINGYINGTGHTRYTMIVNLVASFAVRLPLVWLISRIAGTLFYISLGLPAASLIQVCVGVGFLLFAKSEREQRQKLRLAD